MKIIKLIACVALGVGVACIGVIVCLGVAGVPWLGLILGSGLAVVGSLLSAELAGIGGGCLYAFTAFVATIWLALAPPAMDMLVIPEQLGEQPCAQIWPMLLLVSALIPLQIKFPEPVSFDNHDS